MNPFVGIDSYDNAYESDPVQSLVGLPEQQGILFGVQKGIKFQPNPDYDRYLRIHKVWVGQSGGEYLKKIYSSLSNEQLPRYQTAAGWAAAEAAIVCADDSTDDRLALLRSGVECWQKALAMQVAMNQCVDKPFLAEYSAPYRNALDIAVTPLLEGLVLGYVSDQMCKDAFEDSLEIANANMRELFETYKKGNNDACAEHIGFAHECNARLALNRAKSKHWFALPTMARSDSGHYWSEQSHDLLVVRRKGDEIQSATPVEIKSKASLRDRKRYRALLVRGKMHLCVDGSNTPNVTLDAITSVEMGEASSHQKNIAYQITQKFMEMIKDYYRGERLGNIATTDTLTSFHDKTFVVQNHRGLAIPA